MKQPGRDTQFKVTRRQFWRALVQEATVTYNSLKGRPGYALADLGSLPDKQLACIKPVLHPDCETFVDRGHVWSRCNQTGVILKLFPTEQENLFAFQMFDGRHDLREIGERLAQELGWDPARGFAHAKDLFLLLVSYLACIPSAPLDAIASDED